MQYMGGTTMLIARESVNYFWNLSPNRFGYEKNIYDCRIHISFYKENLAVFCFMSKRSKILFAEFKRIKVTPEFVTKVTKGAKTKPVLINTSSFEKEALINLLLSAKGGDTPVNEAFDKFVCLWL